MLDDNLKARIENINRMILEVASGNFAYKIERSDKDDELEALTVLVNMMAEEMKESFTHRGRLHVPHKIAAMTFILRDDFSIQTFNLHVSQILHFGPDELEGKFFEDLLTPESKAIWKNIKTRIARPDNPHLVIELRFRASDTLIVPAFCSISPLFSAPIAQRNILITAIEAVHHEETKDDLNDRDDDDNSKARITLREPDIRKIREAHDHILKDFEETFSLKELAHAFGINEFKLKYGFKQLYGTTVFRFLLDERLKKANLLLQNTDMSLKQISEMTGFKSFPHFSKVFKKRFGHCPSDFRSRGTTSLF